MRVVVTGSSGMVGTALCERLGRLNYEAIPVDREPNRWSAQIDAMTWHIDLLDPSGLFDLPRSDIDMVVHCAANARVHDLVVQPDRALENMQTCGHALEYARAVGAPFVFTSSREVYGNQNLERYGEEDATLSRVESPYAASKLAGEALVQSYWRVYGLPGTIVRLSNVYGPYDLSDRFIPVAIRTALGGSTLTVFGQEKRLDFTYLEDAVEGLMGVIEHRPEGEGDVFNIASGGATALSEAAQLVGRALGREIPIRYESSRPGEVVAYEAAITKAALLLGYRPRYTLQSGLPLAVNWYRQQYESESIGSAG